MAVLGLNRDWRKHDVTCRECGAFIKRRLFHPQTGEPLSMFFCNFDCKGVWQKRARPVSAEWLRARYIDDRMDCTQIGAIVGRDPKRVWDWLRDDGIATRPRGGNGGRIIACGSANPMFGRTHSIEARAKISEKAKARGTFPKDGGLPYWAGKRGAKHPTWKGGATPKRQAFYASDAWKAARRAVYARAKARCERCGDAGPMHVHHVWPFLIERLRADTANLRLLCTPCHRFVHSKQNANREFLPPVGVLPVSINGEVQSIPISYFPTHKGRLPTWIAN